MRAIIGGSYRERRAAMKEDGLQTPAERALVEYLAARLRELNDAGDPAPRVLAVGAGRSLSVEDKLTAAGVAFVTDRADVEDCKVADPRVEHCWTCSAEDMAPVPSGTYPLAFANYVLEHVPDPAAAAKEIFRVLRPGGTFVASFPNPRAWEFRVSAATPTWLHGMVRGKEAWETHYAYGTVKNLVKIFETAGLRADTVRQFAFLEGYLGRFPLLGALARAADRRANAGGVSGGMGQAFASFVKGPGG